LSAVSKLVELASTIRSKNAGVDHITFDILFADPEVYQRVKASQVLTRERVADLYHVDPERVVRFVTFDPAQAIKFTIRRQQPSGSPGEGDVMGSQQYAPLLELEVPDSVLQDRDPVEATGPAARHGEPALARG